MTDADTHAEPQRPWVCILIRSLIAFVIIAVGFGAWSFFRGAISRVVQREENLPATRFTFQLVGQFVAEQGRWPRSWGELEAMPVASGIPAPIQGNWPASSPKIQTCVFIDFSADEAKIARQDPMVFTAIKPIGPH